MALYTTAKLVVAGLGGYGSAVVAGMESTIQYVERIFGPEEYPQYRELLRRRCLVSHDSQGPDGDLAEQIAAAVAGFPLADDSDSHFYYKPDNYLFLVSSLLTQEDADRLVAALGELKKRSNKLRINLVLNLYDFAGRQVSPRLQALWDGFSDNVSRIYVVGAQNSQGEDLFRCEADSVEYLAKFMTAISLAGFDDDGFQVFFGSDNGDDKKACFVPGLKQIDCRLEGSVAVFYLQSLKQLWSRMVGESRRDSGRQPPAIEFDSLWWPIRAEADLITVPAPASESAGLSQDLNQDLKVYFNDAEKNWREGLARFAAFQSRHVSDHDVESLSKKATGLVEESLNQAFAEGSADTRFQLRPLLGVIRSTRAKLALEKDESQPDSGKQVSADFTFTADNSDLAAAFVAAKQSQLYQLQPDKAIAGLVFSSYILLLVVAPAVMMLVSGRGSLSILLATTAFSMVHLVLVALFWRRSRKVYDRLAAEIRERLHREITSLYQAMDKRLAELKKQALAEAQEKFRQRVDAGLAELEKHFEQLLKLSFASADDSAARNQESLPWYFHCDNKVSASLRERVDIDIWLNKPDLLGLNLSDLQAFTRDPEAFRAALQKQLQARVAELIKYDLRRVSLEIRQQGSSFKCGETLLSAAILAKFDKRDDFPIHYRPQLDSPLERLLSGDPPYLAGKVKPQGSQCKDYRHAPVVMPDRLALLALLRIDRDQLLWEGF